MLVTDRLRGHPVAIRFNFPFNQRLIQPSSVEIDQCSELDVPRSDQQQYQWQQQIGPVDGKVNANQLLQGKQVSQIVFQLPIISVIVSSVNIR